MSSYNNVARQFNILFCNCVILGTNKRAQIQFIVMLFSHGPNKAFLDSCRVAVRYGNNIRANFTEDTIKNHYNYACFSYFKTN